MAGRRAGSRDVAPRIRAAFLRALDGKKVDFHALMEKSLNEDFLGTLNAIARYVPKELMLQGDLDNPLELSGRVELSIKLVEPNGRDGT